MFRRQQQGDCHSVMSPFLRFCGSRGLKNLQAQEFAGAAVPLRDRQRVPVPDVSGANSKGDCRLVTVPGFAAAAVSRICRFKNLLAPRSHTGTNSSECQSLMFPRQQQGDSHSVTVPVFAAAAVSRICSFKNLLAPRSRTGTCTCGASP